MLPIYDGNIHPNEWSKQIQTYCFLKKITKDEEILKFAIMMIDSTINIPEKLTSLDELINALKQDVSYPIVKVQMKKKLKLLKYIPEAQGGETSKFINTFRQLCYNADINDIEEQKEYFKQTLSSNFYLYDEFSKRKVKISSINELIKEFEEIAMEESNIIRNGSIVALKHVATGKYLSSISGLNYTTGSNTQLVFANNLLDSNALWKITFTSGKELSSYTDTNIYLQHKKSNIFLGIYNDGSYKSPVTQHTEVICLPNNGYNYSSWKFNNSKIENDQGYLKSNDILNIKNVNLSQHFLRGHDFQFTIKNDTFQEVVCHNERLGRNDEWCIELI